MACFPPNDTNDRRTKEKKEKERKRERKKERKKERKEHKVGEESKLTARKNKCNKMT